MSAVDVDLRDVFAGIEAMRRAGKDMRPVFKELEQPLRQDLKTHFDTRQGPEGPWAPWSQSYYERQLHTKGTRLKRRRGGRKLLPGGLSARGARRMRNMLGRLRTAWKFTISRVALEAASLVPWSLAHQEGATTGHGVRLPARPFAFAGEKLLDLFASSAADFIARAWGR